MSKLEEQPIAWAVTNILFGAQFAIAVSAALSIAGIQKLIEVINGGDNPFKSEK